MNLNDRFTILIGTCDKYSFLWDDFAVLFNRYWDHSIEVKKYFISETISKKIDGFDFITPGKIPYSDCLIYALKQINTSHILWLQDDYFLRKKINLNKFEYFFDFIDQNNVDRFGIKDDSKYYTKTHVKDDIWKINQNSLYTVSMQASIWNTEFFKKNLIPNESPWQFEINGSSRLNQRNHKIYFELQNTPWYSEAMKKGQMTNEYYKIKKEEML